MTVQESNGIPQDDSLRFGDLDNGRHERFQIAVMIARDHLYIGNDLDEILKELGNESPLFKFNFRNRMFDIPQEDQLVRRCLPKDPAQLLQEPRHLRGDMYPLTGQSDLPSEMQVCDNQHSIS